jgi:hypothetical protein
MFSASPTTAPVAALSKANIREILSWDSNCPSACMADYIVERLVTSSDITDETAQALGEMVARYYGAEQSLSRDELIRLFSVPYSFAPTDWQVILGVVFRDFIENECKSKKEGTEGVTDQSKQMTPKAFAMLAKKLKVNVEFYILDDTTKRVQSAKAAITEVGVSSPLPEHLEFEPVTESKSASRLKVLYRDSKRHRGGHYDRLMEDTKEVARLNQLDDAISFKGAYVFKISHDNSKSYTPALIGHHRDNINDLKREVKARLDVIQNEEEGPNTLPWHQVRFERVPDVKAKKAEIRVPSRYAYIEKLLQQEKVDPTKLKSFSKEYQDTYVAFQTKDPTVAQKKLADLNKANEQKFQKFLKDQDAKSGKSYEMVIAELKVKSGSESENWSKLFSATTSVKAAETTPYDLALSKNQSKSEIVDVAKDKRDELDAQLARKLQQEAIELDAKLNEQEDADRKFALSLSRRA